MLNFGNEFEARGEQRSAVRDAYPSLFRVMQRVFDDKLRRSSKTASEGKQIVRFSTHVLHRIA
jgi:hypothetical protein